MKFTRLSAWSAVAAIAAVSLVGGTAAHATNAGTVPGNGTQGCEVAWQTSAVLDDTLTNDDPEYPGLMVDLDGNPVGYTNGGYIEEVSPLLGDPGMFEMNHFYTGSGSSLTQIWRIPVATDYTIKDATATFDGSSHLRV